MATALDFQLIRAEIAAGEAALGSAAELARYLGVDRSQVTRAAQGRQRFQLEPAWRLTALEAAFGALRHVIEEDVIPDWLQGANAQLQGRRPIDVLRAGRVAEVMAAIQAERTGSYA
jgi:DNA-binding transcriptional regulator YdaS (Cro superfamily)